MKFKVNHAYSFSTFLFVFSMFLNLACIVPGPDNDSKNLDFSKIALSAEDLPEGFINTVEKEKVTADQLSMYKLSNFGFKTDVPLKKFSLFSSDDKRITFGIITLAYDLSTAENIQSAMNILKKMDVQSFTKIPILDNPQNPVKTDEVKNLPAFSGFGDYSKGFSFQRKGADVSPQFGFALYDNLFLMIVTFTPTGTQPVIEIEKIGKIMEAKVKSAQD